MNLNEYQRWTNTTALFGAMIDKVLWGDETSNAITLLYLSNTINEEAGEIAGKVKRIIRDQAGDVSYETGRALIEELGDLLYYMSQMAQAIGYDMQEVVDINVAKLEDRKARGVIKGSGDKR